MKIIHRGKGFVRVSDLLKKFQIYRQFLHGKNRRTYCKLKLITFSILTGKNGKS